MEKTDVLIIGAGLLGCFAAREMSRYEMNITVVEEREDVCTGISRANTAIVYAGYDTAPGTLKTEMCLRASSGFGGLCRELGVALSRCGSLMISLGERGDRVLEEKFAQGLRNGVTGLRLMNGREVLAMEGELTERVRLGLFCPHTGTVNPWELGIAAYENALKNGAQFRFCEKLLYIRRVPGGYIAQTGRGEIFARGVVNCAGLYADRVREMCRQPGVRIFPSRGDYLVFDKSEGTRLGHIIFHEPERRGKGLTAVPTVDGNLLIGPTQLPFEGEADFSTTGEGIEQLLELCGEIIPGLDRGALIRSFGALRPNPFHVTEQPDGSLRREERGISSFTILSDDGGAFLSLIGIKTPGLTCSRELGAYAARAMAEHLGAGLKSGFDPIRPAPVNLSRAGIADRLAALEKDPLYGRIVCRCAGISEGEVVDAVHRGAVTLDGVKRRAGTGMGRCQGGFCSARIMEIIAREKGMALSDVMKDGPGTYIVGGGRSD